MKPARSVIVAICILGGAFGWVASERPIEGSAHGRNRLETQAAVPRFVHGDLDVASRTLAMAGVNQSERTAALHPEPAPRADLADLSSGASFSSSTAEDSASRLSNIVAAQDWLGPISAVALSPFFGLACLSGIATYGPTSLREHSSLLGVTGPMNNPSLFWCMAVLTLVTSLPRWTKFSKPIALAIDKLEAYSAIVILLVMRFTGDFAGAEAGAIAVSLVPHDTDLVHAGWISLPMDALLAIAMVVNMIVVHTIRLLVDVLVWLVPFPSVDAILEVGNKALCAGLLGIYAFSPLLALVLNVGLFVVCALLYTRARRRLQYLFEMIVMPIWKKAMGAGGVPASTQRVFLSKAWKGFPALSCGELGVDAVGVSTLRLRGWTTSIQASGKLKESVAAGILSDTIDFEADDETIPLLIRKGVFPMQSRETSTSKAAIA